MRKKYYLFTEIVRLIRKVNIAYIVDTTLSTGSKKNSISTIHLYPMAQQSPAAGGPTSSGKKTQIAILQHNNRPLFAHSRFPQTLNRRRRRRRAPASPGGRTKVSRWPACARLSWARGCGLWVVGAVVRASGTERKAARLFLSAAGRWRSQ